MKNSEFPKLKKTLAFILTFAMLLSAVITAAAVPATAASDVWDGTIAESYAGGTGTRTDPFLISDGSQLAKMVNEGDDTLGKFYKLTGDIYLNNTSDSAWKDNSPKSWFTRTDVNNIGFQGTLDGDKHTVSGIYYKGNERLVGLIPATKNNVTVKNLHIADSYLESTSYGIAALIGYANENITISKCYIHEDVTVISGYTDNDKSVGGLMGWGTGSYTVSDCAVLATLSNPSGGVGAVLANSWSSTITVTNTFANNKFGKHPGTINMENCYTAIEDTNYNTEVCSLENMKGEAAKANMPKLDWENVWVTTDGFPEFAGEKIDTGAIWDGTVAEKYAGGTGTREDPYQISNGSQLALMIHDGDLSAGQFYVLTDDIYLNDTSASNWKENNPKSWYSYYTNGNKWFQGTFDGGNHFVRGVYYNGEKNSVGLIPAAKGSVTVKNLQVADSYIESSGYALATLIGFINGTMNISKCYIHESNTVICKDQSDENSAGGLMGYYCGTMNVSDCAILSTRTSAGGRNGAVMANSWGSTLTVTNTFANGAFGKNPGKIIMENCYTAVEDTIYNTDICALEDMKGTAAKANMPKLDWENVWYTTDGFPVFKTETTPESIIWDGTSTEIYAAGSGTQADPYIIENAKQLAYLVKHDIIDTASNNTSFSMGKYYKLAADIYLNDVTDPDWTKNSPNSWYSVAYTQRFGGNIDGDGYTIYGLYYSGTGVAGLIPYADIWSYNITVKNLIISNASLSSDDNAGSIFGYVYTGNAKSLTFENCFVDDNVMISSSGSDARVGGLVGGVKNDDNGEFNFRGCASLADVRGVSWENRSGLAGNLPAYAKNNIDNCFAFPNFAVNSNTKNVDATNSYLIDSPEALLTIIGDNAKTTMTGFDWENGAFAPTQNGYPRLKIVSQRMGDINGDDKSNSEDLILLRKHLLGIETALVWDINSDGEQNILDLVNLKKKTAAYVSPENGYVPEGYSLVWNDEFKGRTIDNAKWSTGYTRMTGTDELVGFNDANVRNVNGGMLLMTAMKNPDPTNPDSYSGAKYITTNSLTTENRMSFKYGYLEVRAKVPYKEGCWPSLWLRSPNATQTDSTGKDGYNMEVDIIEPFGYTDKNKLTIHETEISNSDNHCQAASAEYNFGYSENLSNEFHVYGFLWTENGMTFYVDGNEVISYTMAALKEKGYASNFDDTVNILFNNHLFTASSEFTGESKDNIIENYEENLPSKFAVDYVRLYQKQGDVLVLETPADGQ